MASFNSAVERLISDKDPGTLYWAAAGATPDAVKAQKVAKRLKVKLPKLTERQVQGYVKAVKLPEPKPMPKPLLAGRYGDSPALHLLDALLLNENFRAVALRAFKPRKKHRKGN